MREWQLDSHHGSPWDESIEVPDDDDLTEAAAAARAMAAQVWLQECVRVDC